MAITEMTPEERRHARELVQRWLVEDETAAGTETRLAALEAAVVQIEAQVLHISELLAEVARAAQALAQAVAPVIAPGPRAGPAPDSPGPDSSAPHPSVSGRPT